VRTIALALVTLNALAESGQSIQTPDPVTLFPDLPPPNGNPVAASAGVVLSGVGGVPVTARRRFARRA
jgi:hypothetical protein